MSADRLGAVPGGSGPGSVSRQWCDNAVRLIDADARRSSDTHLLRYPLDPSWAGSSAERGGIALYLKDESTHITGSLKHRLARSLFLHALCNGWVGPETTVIEASSGSTAVSEAYFARLLGLEFVAVIPRSTSTAKVELIEWAGGRCHFVDDPSAIYDESRRLAAETGGHYLDQFTNAERATDWRGNNNIAESIFDQMSGEDHPIPDWVVVGAGTGGTSATIGRYIRYRRHDTRLCVVDPEGSVFYEAWRESGQGDPGRPERAGGNRAGTGPARGSRIEGIGRPRVEPSFIPGVVDAMMRVPDAGSIAATRHGSRVMGRRLGGSTGTNLWGAFSLITQMVEEGRTGSVVTLLCDGGERYADTYFNDDWVAGEGIDLPESEALLEEFSATGRLRG